MRTRQDVVVVDPDRFLAAAREAFLELYPEIPEADVAEHVRDVPDAVFALLERYGRLAAHSPNPLLERPGPPPPVRADGLSPAGRVQRPDVAGGLRLLPS